MFIRNVRHKALRRLMESDDGSGLPAMALTKIRSILSFLQDMETVEEVWSVPSWKAHQLSGERRGDWALRVTRNWRITFSIEDGMIVDLDYEDYH